MGSWILRAPKTKKLERFKDLVRRIFWMLSAGIAVVGAQDLGVQLRREGLEQVAQVLRWGGQKQEDSWWLVGQGSSYNQKNVGPRVRGGFWRSLGVIGSAYSTAIRTKIAD